MYRSSDIYIEAVTHRNHVLGKGIVYLIHATARAVVSLSRLVRQAWRRRDLIRTLEALDDHLLNDAGLERDQISDYAVRYIATHAEPSSRTSLARRTIEFVFLDRRRFNVWREARRTARQLRRLDDKMLADMGIQRGDIHRLAFDLAAHSFVNATAANDNRDTAAA